MLAAESSQLVSVIYGRPAASSTSGLAPATSVIPAGNWLSGQIALGERVDLGKTLSDMSLSAIFAVLGFILLFIGYRVFDWLTPTDLADDIFRKNNVAAAVFAGAFVIALAVIISHAIS